MTAKLKSQDSVFILEFLLLHIIVNFYKKVNLAFDFN